MCNSLSKFNILYIIWHTLAKKIGTYGGSKETTCNKGRSETTTTGKKGCFKKMFL